jgi:hypothetical protein
MHLFIVKGLRGGISMISHRHASQPSSHVTYQDANNLYGWTMPQALPVDGFRWLEKEEFGHLNINSVSDDSEVGKVMTL